MSKGAQVRVIEHTPCPTQRAADVFNPFSFFDVAVLPLLNF